ncbi:MAG TPA: cytochrome c oxidase assembly protein, partial [Gemmatimonadaceae bacterium]|nr:cytochrome c oxidase assembly protein [Gemmatimonadaceae bacterium]
MMALAVLHPIARIEWWKWSIHPSTAIGIAALGALYLGAAHRFRQAPTAKQHIYFFSGLFVMFASLNGPLHDLSDGYLFSAHMVQHLVLTLLMPPLLIAGVPDWMFRPALRNRFVASTARFVTRAQVAFVVFNVVIAAWHLPP